MVRQTYGNMSCNMSLGKTQFLFMIFGVGLPALTLEKWRQLLPTLDKALWQQASNLIRTRDFLFLSFFS